MQRLEDFLQRSALDPVEQAVFGPVTPPSVLDALQELALTATGLAVKEWRWFAASVAFVSSVVLADGSEVVLRAFQRTITERFLSAVVRVQRHVADANFPAPRPLSEPVTLPWGIGRVESLLPDPGPAPLPAEAMALSTAGLAVVTRLASEVDAAGLDEAPMALSEELYPEPHSPIFDLAGTAAGAEWIDEIARVAKSVVLADETVAVSHGDWSARNVRFRDNRVVCAYDWESLELCAESIPVGVAAATWRSCGEANDAIAPDAHEIAQYVEFYEAARGRPFEPVQRQAALAMAVYALAYTARCEHALHPGIRSGRASARLAADGERLISQFT